MKPRLTQKEFVEKCHKKHNNKYDYSKSIYVTQKERVIITCLKHGDFIQIAKSHLRGDGCRLCGNENVSKLYSSNTEEFLKKSKSIHGEKYDYSKTIYKNAHSKVNITCKIHGIFKQEPSNHLRGNGCPNCTYNNGNTKKFIEKAILIHGDKYEYSLVKYLTNKKPVKITCHIHGLFEQTPDKHINRKHGCPFCKASKGELEIKKFLEINNINFIPQYGFKKCKYKSKLLFDFYLPDFNLCIEYNGIQHYKPVAFFGGSNKLKLQKKRDEQKQKFCKTNLINLLIIKYNENINKTLNSYLF